MLCTFLAFACYLHLGLLSPAKQEDGLGLFMRLTPHYSKIVNSEYTVYVNGHY